METETFEGVLEEVAQHSSEFSGKRVRVTVLESAPQPNEVMLAALRKVAERLKTCRSRMAKVH